MLPFVTEVDEGAVLKTIWLVPPLPLSAVLPPTKLTVAPARRVRLANVRVAFCPLVVELIVDPPPARTSGPSTWAAAAALLPTKLSVPPLSATLAEALMRLLL